MTEMKIADKDKFMPFTDNVIFSLVMRDPDICRRVAEMILPDEDIGEVRVATPDNILFDENSDFEVMVQASLDFGKDIRGVRFDAYIKSKNIWIDVEMQTTNEHNIERRSRYYQSMMDSDCLDKGGKFNDLKNTYVVFICTFDYFGKDEPMYIVESYIRKNDLIFDDGVGRILLNTKCSPDRIPEGLRAFYEYINDPSKVDTELVRDINERVRKYNTPEWREKRLTFENMLDEAEKRGEASGRAAEKLEMARAMKADNKPIDEIAKYTGLSKEEIENL